MVVALDILNKNALNALMRDLGKIPKELSDNGRMRELHEHLRDNILIPEFEYQFEVGGDPAWEPVAPGTLANRKHGGGQSVYLDGIWVSGIGANPPLTDRGVFRRSATAKARFRIKASVMSYGQFPNSMWWALPVHELGRASKIPQRSWVGQTIVKPEVQDEIVDTTWDWVRDRIDNAMTRRVYR